MRGFRSYTRNFRRFFNKDYQLIDTSNRIYDGKKYLPEQDKFFQIAKDVQKEKGMTQQDAVKYIHDSFVIKDFFEKGKKSSKEIERIIDDWDSDGYDFDYGVDYIVEKYERKS